MQVEQFEQVKELARYRDAATVAKMLAKLPPDYLPSAAAEAKYQQSKRQAEAKAQASSSSVSVEASSALLKSRSQGLLRELEVRGSGIYEEDDEVVHGDRLCPSGTHAAIRVTDLSQNNTASVPYLQPYQSC